MPDHRRRDARDRSGRPVAPPPRPAAAAPRLGAEQVEALRALVEPAVASAGLVLDDLVVAPAGARRVVRVVVDLPDDAIGSLPLDDVATASRAVDAALEAGGDAVLGGAPYVLEVGTPGTARPLTERRHWARARTRVVRVPVDGVEVTGRLLAVDDEGVVLAAVGAPGPGRGAAVDPDRHVPWSSLGAGRLELEFSRPDEPDDDELDDELDDDEDEED